VSRSSTKMLDAVFFNTYAQPHGPKLICWLSLPRHFLLQEKRIELLLPRRVAMRYVTTVFIESENYMPEFNDT